MTRKDFSQIAEIIANLDVYVDGDNYGHDVRRHVLQEFANALQRTNDRFDAEIFISSCKMESYFK